MAVFRKPEPLPKIEIDTAKFEGLVEELKSLSGTFDSLREQMRDLAQAMNKMTAETKKLRIEQAKHAREEKRRGR
jgi:regulator of replication initiation timing